MRRLISLGVSAVILGLLYWMIDVDQMVRTLGQADPGWVLAAVAFTYPLLALTAFRLTLIGPRPGLISFGYAQRLVLIASSLNLVLPSKMGDIAKAFVIVDHGHMPGSEALSFVILEKALDLASLLVWCVLAIALVWDGTVLLGLLFAGTAGALALCCVLIGWSGGAAWGLGLMARLAPGRIGEKVRSLRDGWVMMLGAFWQSPRRAAFTIGLSLVLWLGHLLQIWLFVLALDTAVPFVDSAAYAALAILVGLLPFTFAGVGTRDAALIYFFQPYLAPAAGAALGLLCTLRYLLPGLAGLPFFGECVSMLRRIRRAPVVQP
jgi:uncharacterized membrane protein YbhN (UPF0104 family)